MGEENSFTESVKISFKKAKIHADKLENEIESLKLLIKAQNEQITELKVNIESSKEEISIGNHGVQASNQASKHQASTKQAPSKQAIKHGIPDLPEEIFVLKGVPEEFAKPFKTLTRQEFMAFLTLYQIEDEKGFATYSGLAESMCLSTSCIRGYISSTILKGAPILRQKPNNRSTILRIQPSFRELELKQRLINIFYKKDPDQLTLNN